MAVILVTGASTGLGRNAAVELVLRGHDVVVHARTDERLPEPPEGTSWAGGVVGDLADREATEDVAAQATRFGRFDAVIHNAGALHPPEALPVNIVAPYLLTALMEKPARLVYLSSGMHRGGSTDLNRLTNGRASYSDTKLWVTALTLAVSDRWPGTVAHAVDPGWVPTRMGGAGAPDDLRAGHETQVWLATADDVEPETGGYWHHLRTQRPAPPASDPSFQRDLIAGLEQLTGVVLP